MSYYVYRFFNKENEVIYVGRTNNLKTRMNQHFNAKDEETSKRNEMVEKIDYVEIKSKIHSNLYEIQMIDYYKPKYNKDYIEEDFSEIIVKFDHLIFTELEKEIVIKLKSKKNKKVNSKKINSLKKYEKKTFNYYIDNYGFSESESYMMIKALEICHGQCFYISDIMCKKSNITFNMAKEFVSKLIKNKFARKLEVKSDFSDEYAYCLHEEYVDPNFQL